MSSFDDESNIIIEKSVALSSAGKQLKPNSNLLSENLFTSEAIFLISYQNYEPVKLKTKQKSFINNSVIAR